MAPSKLRRAIGAVKDRTSIGLAKVTNSTSISDLDVAIVKATRHDEYPAEERHIREILNLTSYSRHHINQCVATLSRRLGKTQSWTVALKTLILIHRLLTEGDPTYEQEIFFATRRGTRMLNLSDFRDTSRSDAWDYSAFVRTYARYLDEMLEYKMHGRRTRRRSRSQQMHEDWEEQEQQQANKALSSPPVQLTPVRDMKTEKIFVRTQHLQQLLERFIACRPTGSAKQNRIIGVALFPILKESTQLYYDIQEVMAIFVDRFMELEVPDCFKIYDIFSRLAKQFDELDRFYGWCKSAGISRSSEFPEIERITQKKLDVMDEFIRKKSYMSAHAKKAKSFEQLTSEEDAMRKAAEDELLQIKALAAPEPQPAQEPYKVEEPTEEVKEEEPPQTLAIVKLEEEVDFLNLRDDTMTIDNHANNLALALFDSNPISNISAPPVWEAFTVDTLDWETALVESASNLSCQKPTVGGGFDMLLLDGMYSKPRPAATLGLSNGGGGSTSSMVLPKAPAAPMLALPVPPTMGGGCTFGGDPFVASLSVPPPSYVQMREMEWKQGLLAEEQLMWQQYAKKDGIQGQISIAKLQQAWMHPTAGGYIQRF